MADTTLTTIKTNFVSCESNWKRALPDNDVSERTQQYFCGISARSAQTEHNCEETSDKPKSMVILQNNWPAPFRDVSIVKEKDWEMFSD